MSPNSSLGLDLFKGGGEPSRIPLVFNPDLFRGELADKDALRGTPKVSYSRKTFIQVQPPELIVR